MAGWMDALSGLVQSGRSASPDWLNWSTGLGALSSLAGLGTGIYGMSQQQAQQRALERLAKSPVDPNLYYKPMSDAAMAAMMRGWGANAVTQGTPPEYFQKNLGPELLAKTETERWSEAMRLAQMNRQAQLNAMMNRQTLPTIGDISAFPNAMAANQLRKERLAAQQRNEEMQGRWYDLYKNFWGSPQSNPEATAGAQGAAGAIPSMQLQTNWPTEQAASTGFTDYNTSVY